MKILLILGKNYWKNREIILFLWILKFVSNILPTIVDDNTVSNMVSKVILPEEGALEQLDHDEIRQEIYQDIKTRL